MLITNAYFSYIYNWIAIRRWSEKWSHIFSMHLGDQWVNVKYLGLQGTHSHTFTIEVT